MDSSSIGLSFFDGLANINYDRNKNPGSDNLTLARQAGTKPTLIKLTEIHRAS
jgi:hypothetical protein